MAVAVRQLNHATQHMEPRNKLGKITYSHSASPRKIAKHVDPAAHLLLKFLQLVHRPGESIHQKLGVRAGGQSIQQHVCVPPSQVCPLAPGHPNSDSAQQSKAGGQHRVPRMVLVGTILPCCISSSHCSPCASSSSRARCKLGQQGMRLAHPASLQLPKPKKLVFHRTFSDRSATSFLRMSPVDRCTQPYFSTIRWHCVPLPLLRPLQTVK